MGMIGFIIGSAAGQLCGAWIYRLLRSSGRPPDVGRAAASTAAGLVTTVVSTGIYIPFGVHTWVGGDGTTWGASIFLAVCMGLCQAILGRGRPWSPESTMPPP